MKAADRALEALRGLKRRKGSEGKRPLKSEVINAKRAKKCAWKHRFVCLAWKDQGRVPTTDTEKDDLMKAGLGEKTIEFSSLDMSAEMRSILLFQNCKKVVVFIFVNALQIPGSWNYYLLLCILHQLYLKSVWVMPGLISVPSSVT